MKKLAAIALTLALTCACLPAVAEMIFDGTIGGDTYITLNAPFGGDVTNMNVRAGDRISKGDIVATISTTYVYAPVDGTVTGVFGAEGDSTESVSERYGGVMYIEPTNKYTVSATTDKAYNDSANRFIRVGEDVYLRCTADGSHMGVGRVISVGEDNSYKVEATGGEFLIGESVGIFRMSNYQTSSRIGLGTVKPTAPIAVKGAGSIIKLHVKSGDKVERGELLFETAEGALDGLYAPSAEVMSTTNGIVISVDAAEGTAAAQGAKIITVLPDDELYVTIKVLESDLGTISTGMGVQIDLLWNIGARERLNGTVTGISYLNGSETGEPSYTAYISFVPEDDVRLGMTALVYVSNEQPLPTDDVPDLEIEPNTEATEQ